MGSENGESYEIAVTYWVEGKIPWRRRMQPTHGLAGKSRGQKSLEGYSRWGCKELNKTEHAHTHTLSRNWALTTCWALQKMCYSTIFMQALSTPCSTYLKLGYSHSNLRIWWKSIWMYLFDSMTEKWTEISFDSCS